MTTLTIAAVDTAGHPLAHRTVEVAVIAGRPGGHPAAGGPVIAAPVQVRLDEDGTGEVDVDPTDTLDAPGVFVRCTVLGSSPTIVRSLTIPTGPSTVDWADPDLQVADPVIPEVGITRRQLDQALADAGSGGVSVHGDLSGRDAPGQHPADAVTVDPADVPLLDPAGFEAALSVLLVARGMDPVVAAATAAAMAAGVVPSLSTPDTVTAALDSAAGLATSALMAVGSVSADLSADLAAHAGETTGAHGGIVASTDPRLSDARTPLGHAASHAAGGLDEVTAAAIGAAPTVHTHDAAAIASGVVAPARLGSGVPSAATVLDGTGSWVTAPGAMGAWTPLANETYPLPHDLLGADGSALPAEAPSVGTTWWSWGEARGPWAIAQLGVSVAAVGATPSTLRFHIHTRSASGRPGVRLWVAPATVTVSATGILWLALAAPVTIPAWTVWGVGVQCVAGGTSTLHCTGRRQEPTAPTAGVPTNNVYRWVAAGQTSALGDSPTVGIASAPAPKILVRTAA